MLDSRYTTTELLAPLAPRVTALMVQRERYSPARIAIEAFLACTPADVDLIYVDGGSPWEEEQAIAAIACRSDRLRVLRYESPLRLNLARRFGVLAMGPVGVGDMDFVLLLDNDVIVEPGWFEPLLARAAQGVPVVMPLILEGDPAADEPMIHSAGWAIEIEGDDRHDQIKARHDFQHSPLSRHHLESGPITGIELHCCLMRRSVFDQLDWDDRLDEPFSFLDISLQLRRLGQAMWLEAQSQVTFLHPQMVGGFTPADLELYLFRWDDRVLDESVRYLRRRWRLTAADPLLWRIWRWAIANRQVPLQLSIGPQSRCHLLLKVCKLALCPWWLRQPIEGWVRGHVFPVHGLPMTLLPVDEAALALALERAAERAADWAADRGTTDRLLSSTELQGALN
jgi:glycosyltransferase involved in cell wall biosynthesis